MVNVVYHAYYLEETQHTYKLSNYEWCLPECVPMCMCNNFMPMRMCAIRLNHNGFIIITPIY